MYLEDKQVGDLIISPNRQRTYIFLGTKKHSFFDDVYYYFWDIQNAEEASIEERSLHVANLKILDMENDFRRGMFILANMK